METPQPLGLVDPPSLGCELPEEGREWIECLKKLVNGHEDFFPIPWLPWPPSSTGRGSRSRARRRHLAAVREVAERTWTSLNVTGATVHVHARSQQGPPCRLYNASLDEGHKATWGLILKDKKYNSDAKHTNLQFPDAWNM